jgi:hypothetical protein
VDALRRDVWSSFYSAASGAPPLVLYTPVMQLWITHTGASALSSSPPPTLASPQLSSAASSSSWTATSSTTTTPDRSVVMNNNEVVVARPSSSTASTMLRRNKAAAVATAGTGGGVGGSSTCVSEGSSAAASIAAAAAGVASWTAARRSEDVLQSVVRCLSAEVGPVVRKLSKQLLQDCGRMYLPLQHHHLAGDDTDACGMQVPARNGQLQLQLRRRKERGLQEAAVAMHVLEPLHSTRLSLLQ